MATQSDRASAAVAAMAEELMRRPRFLLKKYIHSFTPMEAARIAVERREKATSSGWRIFPTALLNSSTPTSMMATDTASPARYSIRPWPNGWSSSAFCPARRKPTRVTREEAASDRLLKASAVTDTEPVMTPAINFPRESNRFSRMPTIPDMVPYRSRTAGSFPFW